MQGRIYALFDPREPERIRYIGQTTLTIQQRRDAHVYSAVKQNNQWYRDHWIRKIISEDVEPQVRLLLEGDWTPSELDNHEIAAIARYKMLGHPLTNMTAGGYGFRGMPRSPAHRAAIALAKTGKPRDAATKAKLSKALKGRKLSPEHVTSIARSTVGRTKSISTRAKISATKKANRWQCNECEMISTPGALGRHQKKTNHIGRHRP